MKPVYLLLSLLLYGTAHAQPPQDPVMQQIIAKVDVLQKKHLRAYSGYSSDFKKYYFMHENLRACHSPNNKGVELALNKDFNLALTNFKSALRDSTNDTNAIKYNIGLTLLMNGDYVKAIDVFTRLLDTPLKESNNLYINLSNAHFMKSTRLKRVRPSFDLALKYSELAKSKNEIANIADYNSAVISTYVNRHYFPEAYIKNGQFGTPYEKSFVATMNAEHNQEGFSFDNLSKEFPTQSHYLNDKHLITQVNYAYYLIEKNRLINGQKFLSGIGDKTMGNKFADFASGKSYYKSGNLVSSRREFVKIQNKPNKIAWLANYGFALVDAEEGRLDWAVINSGKVLKKNPDAYETYLIAGRSFYQQALKSPKYAFSYASKDNRKKIDTAYYLIDKYLAVSNKSSKDNIEQAEMIYAYLNIHPLINRVKTAYMYFEKIIEYKKYHIDGCIGMAICLYRIGAYDKAHALLKEAVEHGTDAQKSVAYQYQGELFFTTFNYDRAASSYENALKLTKDSAAVAVGLGNAYLKIGKYEKSDRMYALAEKSNIPEALLINNRAVARFQTAKDKFENDKDTLALRNTVDELEIQLKKAIAKKVVKEDSLMTWVCWLNLSTFYCGDKRTIKKAETTMRAIDSVSRTKNEWYLNIIRARGYNNLGIGYAISDSLKHKASDTFDKATAELPTWLLPEHNKKIFEGKSSLFTFLEEKYSKTFDKYVYIYTFLHTYITESPGFSKIEIAPLYDLKYPCIPVIDFVVLNCR